jgi:hypothetical protein
MNTPPTVRTFTITSPIRACRLRRDDLKRLYRIFNERQIEHRDSFLPVIVQQPNETPEQFQERKARVANSFVVHANITGADNEIISGVGEHFLDSENIPDNILMFYLTTTAGLNALGLTEQNQMCRATLLLDFSRPSILDFSKLPTLPTPNSSQFTIFSGSET